MPPPEIVTVPLLCAPVLAETLILNEPLPVRLAGVIFEIVSQEVALLLTFHVMFEVTLTVLFCAADVGLHAVAGLTVRFAAGACTQNVLSLHLVCPPTVADTATLN